MPYDFTQHQELRQQRLMNLTQPLWTGYAKAHHLTETSVLAYPFLTIA